MTEPIFGIIRVSSFERAAIQDVLRTAGGLAVSTSCSLKFTLKRTAFMLTPVMMKFDGVTEWSID